MVSKRQTHRTNKGSAEQTSPKPNTNPQVSDTFNSEIHPASLSQRARIAPRTLSPRQVQHLQRTVGNQAVHQVLVSTVQTAPSTPIIQRLVDRNQVEESARPVMLQWIRSQSGNQKYAAVGTQYEALLDGLDVYHAFLDNSAIRAYQDDGVDTFKQQMHNQISTLRSLCMALTIADDDGDLDQVVVNFVLDSLNQEEGIVDAIAQQFSGGIPMLNRQGWDGQFTGKTYRKAIAIAKFVLPVYGRNYLSERAFVRFGMLPRSMPKRGYKLHVSLHKISMVQARDTLLPYLKTEGYMHKIVADPDDLTGSQVGKVVTIYPKTEEQAREQTGFNQLVQHIDGQAAAWGLIAGAEVPGETPLGNRGLIYQEANAQYTG